MSVVGETLKIQLVDEEEKMMKRIVMKWGGVLKIYRLVNLIKMFSVGVLRRRNDVRVNTHTSPAWLEAYESQS